MEIRPMQEMQEIGAQRALWFARRYVMLSETTEGGKGPGEMARDLVSRFVLGEEIYDILYTAGMKNMIQKQSQRPHSFTFLLALQSYTLAPFNRAEIDEIASNFAWVFSPRQPMKVDNTTRDLSVLPENLDGLKTTPDEIYLLLQGNHWIIPLLLLSTAEVEEVFPAVQGDR